MKHLVLAFIILISTKVFAAPEDQVYLDAIAKNPRSENVYYDFAYYLYSKKRFSESRAQLTVLFGLNSSHVNGRKLNRHITEIEGLNDTAYMDRQMQLFMTDKAKEDEAKQEPASKGPAVDDAEHSRILVDLEKKYGLQLAIKNEYKTGQEEEAFRSQAREFIDKQEFSDAEKTYKNWMKKYPDSGLAQTDFLYFLIVRDRLQQAEILHGQSKGLTGVGLRSRLIGDCIKEMKAAKSTEQKENAKIKFKKYISVYEKSLPKPVDTGTPAVTSECAKVTVDPSALCQKITVKFDVSQCPGASNSFIPQVVCRNEFVADVTAKASDYEYTVVLTKNADGTWAPGQVQKVKLPSLPPPPAPTLSKPPKN